MTDNNNEELLSVESDTSFVILSNGSLHPSIVEDRNSNAENLLMSSTHSLTPFKKSDSAEPLKSSFFNGLSNFGNEAQDMINQLLQENLQLKDTLSQNNLAIKSHLNNFFLRQQEMLEAQETHKQKFSEMKELILKLKAENSDLKKQLDYYLLKMANKSVIDANVYSDVKKKTDTTSVQNIEQLLKEEQDKCKELEISKENLSLKNIELKKAVNNLEKEVLKLNDKLEDLERLQQLKSFESRPQEDGFPTFSLPNSEARTQINNLLSQLEDERAKNLKLKQELEREKTNSLIVSQNKSTALELSQCLNKLEEMSVSLEKQTERFNSFNSWISLSEKSFSSIEGNKKGDREVVPEINKLKSQLSNETTSSQQNQMNLEKMNADYSKLVDEYKAVQEKIKDFENVSKNAKELKEKVANLSEELNRKNQELKEKETECTNLKEEVEILRSKCEDISALQVQADVYKHDFQEEREARQKLAGEKELMAEKIRLLQTQIQNLETDKSASSDNSESPTKSPEKTKKARYVCPKCMFAFSNLKMCEDHVEECINTLFYP